MTKGRRNSERHPLVTALMVRYPGYTENEITRAANLMIRCIAEAVAEGRGVIGLSEVMVAKMRLLAQELGDSNEAALDVLLDPREDIIQVAVATAMVQLPNK